MNGKTMDMTAGRPAALLLRFSMPLIFGNLFQQLYTFVDTVIVGQKLGVPALAALGATEWLSFMMFGFIQGLTQGFSIGISQSFGEGKKHLVQQGIFQAFCASAGAAVIVTVIGQGILVPVLKLLRTPEELLEWLIYIWKSCILVFRFRLPIICWRPFCGHSGTAGHRSSQC